VEEHYPNTMKKIKAVKLFIGDQRLKDIYPYATRWEVIKWKTARFFRKVLILSFIAGLIFGAFKLGVSTNGVSYASAERIEIDNLSVKINQLKWEVVDKLQACESAGYTEEQGLVTFDPDKSGKKSHVGSYGNLQYKQPTVQHYMKKLYNKEVTGKEAILIALDLEQARQLTYDIIFKEIGGVNNWLNCANKLGLHGDINIIRKLES
jgi:hypothetical protein